ncbi:MAG: hypothetical protein ACLP3C_02310 [Mycobacterium sp.]|uniref:hypothetical protein n=1 Tax=Mycobacterium sp. TaxID=1785 RepID=UPI003C4E62A9
MSHSLRSPLRPQRPAPPPCVLTAPTIADPGALNNPTYGPCGGADKRAPAAAARARPAELRPADVAGGFISNFADTAYHLSARERTHIVRHFPKVVAALVLCWAVLGMPAPPPPTYDPYST